VVAVENYTDFYPISDLYDLHVFIYVVPTITLLCRFGWLVYSTSAVKKIQRFNKKYIIEI